VNAPRNADAATVAACVAGPESQDQSFTGSNFPGVSHHSAHITGGIRKSKLSLPNEWQPVFTRVTRCGSFCPLGSPCGYCFNGTLSPVSKATYQMRVEQVRYNDERIAFRRSLVVRQMFAAWLNGMKTHRAMDHLFPIAPSLYSSAMQNFHKASCSWNYLRDRKNLLFI